MNAPSSQPSQPDGRSQPSRLRLPSEQSGRPVVPSRGRLRPLGLNEVRISGGFWGHRQEVNASATLEHCLTWMNRLGWIGNFRSAARDDEPWPRAGREFSDSEIYKLSEAMAWEIGRTGNGRVRKWLAELTDIVGAAQKPDGYLNTAFDGPGQQPRYTDLEWGHELYCYGFLIQAAVAHTRVAGVAPAPDQGQHQGEDDSALLHIARRAADHICDVFGPDRKPGICGHAEIEMALVELARLTGEQRYLDQARLFVERHGQQTLADIEFGRAYYQDDVPVRHATVLRGHAVRALYLAAGAVDVAVETGDDELLEAVQVQWRATVARRTYLTGGMGSRHQDEAYGEDFFLPPDRAYSETCAGVASVMLNWRLLLATGEPRYADLTERTLYNVIATSPAADGKTFFYANTLHQRVRGTVPDPDRISPRALSSLRAPWFAVSCCPNNIARTLASLQAYLATADDDGIQIHQYADAEISTSLADGRDIALRVRTRYPDDGDVVVQVMGGRQRSDSAGRSASDTRPWTLSLRVPAWADDGAWLTMPDGQRRPVSPGMVDVNWAFSSGDEVRLELPVRPRWIEADPRVDAVRGTAAVERGPVVMCAESVDLPDDLDVDSVCVDPTVAPTEHDGQVTVAGSLVDTERDDDAWPYRESGSRPPAQGRPAEITLIPYHSWAERGPSTMRVWLPTI
ncbi:glycoside hydrolase family 127 protein [Phytoactinopolyspora halotolerans]|uniref:Glycoside hydrolase family 127 protein n=1 Tax=Phytoactinopolyspora halotolerans TaxID=1981512 RepID=A0A6L9S9V9_9ACTN|nr:beta-L-arabinofuranosidase domain-containing protein [Phytoactinopolyspora halotolerans]NEE01813.1 glycoside hydrolase family 127 protein [Phytoactinopolyspora halotolerans]